MSPETFPHTIHADYHANINNWIYFVQIDEALQNTVLTFTRKLLIRFRDRVFNDAVSKDDIEPPTMVEIYKAYTLMEAYWKDIPLTR